MIDKRERKGSKDRSKETRKTGNIELYLEDTGETKLTF